MCGVLDVGVDLEPSVSTFCLIFPFGSNGDARGNDAASGAAASRCSGGDDGEGSIFKSEHVCVWNRSRICGAAI